MRFETRTLPLGEVGPIAAFSARGDGSISIDMLDMGAFFTFSLFEAGTDVPLRADMCVTFMDIDASQTYGFKPEDGKLEQVQVFQGSSVCYTEDGNYPGYLWLFDDSARNIPEDGTDLSGDVRLCFSDVTRFTIANLSWMRLTAEDLDDGREDPAGQENEIWGRYRNALSGIQRGSFDPWQMEPGTESLGGFRHRAQLSRFTGLAFGTQQVQEPVKTIERTEGVTWDAESECFRIAGDTFVYRISQFLPASRRTMEVSWWEIFDAVPEGLEILDTWVLEDGAVCTGVRFSAEVDDQEVYFTSVESDEMDAFFGHSYTFCIRCRIGEDVTGVFANMAESVLSAEDMFCEGETGEVLAEADREISLEMPGLLVQKRLSESVSEDTYFLYRLERDDGRYDLLTVLVPAGTAFGQSSASLEAAEDGNTFRVTEIENTHWRLSGTALLSGTGSADAAGVTCELHAAPLREQAEVLFEGEVLLQHRLGDRHQIWNSFHTAVGEDT